MASFSYFFIATLLMIQSAAPLFGGKNVILIVVDDLRPALRCYGDSSAHTPNIDSLAQHSFIFIKAYAQQALCGPSRTSFLTSRSPHHLHQYDAHQYWRASVGNFTSLPQYFRENGYHTASIGKVFHPGKCSNFDDQPYSWSEKPFHPKTEKYKNYPVCPDVHGSGPSKSIVCPVSVDMQPGETLPDLESVEAAKNYLDSRKGNSQEPFFLAVGFQKPHIPLKFPVEYLKHHPLDKVVLPSMKSRPPLLPNSAWNPWIDLRQRDDVRALNISFPWGQMPDSWAKMLKQSYYAAVSYVDSLIGELLQKLDALGQRNNTIILLTSDHGWSLGEHGEWSKYSNYEVSTRVPFILSIPGKKGDQVGNLVELLDIFPTLADVAGLAKIPECKDGFSQILCTDGRNIMDLIRERREALPDWRNEAYSQYPRPGPYPSQFPDSDQPHLRDIKIMGYSVRTSQHRYTEWVQFDTSSMAPIWTNSFGAELYDHVIDPDENLNLFDRQNLRPLVLSMKEKLRKRWSH